MKILNIISETNLERHFKLNLKRLRTAVFCLFISSLLKWFQPVFSPSLSAEQIQGETMPLCFRVELL